jgi:hypothetical protein
LTSYEPGPTLAERLARALDADDVVTVVGLLTLAEDEGIAALPPTLLERLNGSTVHQIAGACGAKRAPKAVRDAPGTATRNPGTPREDAQ